MRCVRIVYTYDWYEHVHAGCRRIICAFRQRSEHCKLYVLNAFNLYIDLFSDCIGSMDLNECQKEEKVV